MNEKVQDALERLEEGLKTLLSEDKWKSYLRFQAQFHSYSFQNTLLILFQCPHARRVAGYQAWKKLGRHVRKGEKGITIIAPMLVKEKDDETEELGKIVLKGFRGATVFDISQTEGEPLPEIPIHRLQGAWENWSTIRTACPFPIEEKDDLKGANGCFYTDTRSIALLKSLDERHKSKTLIHEWAHGLLHVPSEEKVVTKIRELEAESVAFVVADALGLDTSSYSFGYIAHWSGENALDQLKASGMRIQKAANRILDSILPNLLQQAS
ncbi:ArdC-like ssDNA-binding domain-containing protein [Alicyclobacillus tolerans]|uniref:ArdC-like ssDNA-binding domain-containing protein n=1 Tax=Alicyclobacillus tolerans TaxID=90970 RepID=UPI003B7A0FE8